jgi:hypothetical protein
MVRKLGRGCLERTAPPAPVGWSGTVITLIG